MIEFNSQRILDIGSAYGTAKAGLSIGCCGVMRPDLVMKNMIPVVMAGILGIYGLIMSIIITQSSKKGGLKITRSVIRLSSWGS